MRSPLVLLFALSLIPIASAMAKGHDNETGFTEDVDKRCQVWAPSMLGSYDHALRYKGGCKNGHADGKGKAEWLYRWSEMKVKAAWEGEFRNGVFLGDQKIKGAIEPMSGDRYAVEMGSIPGADVVFLSTSPQDGPMALCKVDQLALVLGARIPPADDEQVKRIMVDGAKLYRGACPQGNGNLNLGVYTEALRPLANGREPRPMASARVETDSGKLTGYSNEASAKAQREKQQAEFTVKQDETRKKFNDFSKRNGIVSWVTTQQLDENPFRWEGKVVGVVVRLERMVSRDSALVRSGLRDWSPSVLLDGITPDFPESKETVLIAARIGKRQALADKNPNDTSSYTALHAIESKTCEQHGCSDWFIWARGDRGLVWGEPFTPR
jgi:hypothetical protein